MIAVAVACTTTATDWMSSVTTCVRTTATTTPMIALGSGSPDFALAAAAAKVRAGAAVEVVARLAHQVHGAIGYTAEFDLGLWINRVRALAGAWGDASYHRARVAEGLR